MIGATSCEDFLVVILCTTIVVTKDFITSLRRMIVFLPQIELSRLYEQYSPTILDFLYTVCIITYIIIIIIIIIIIQYNKKLKEAYEGRTTS